MDIDDIRFLYGFDRWATTKVLDAAVGVDEATWSAPNVIGERGLDRAGLASRIGPERIFFTLPMALEGFRRRKGG